MFDDDANIDCFFFQNTFCCINTKLNQCIFVADLKLHNSVAELFASILLYTTALW